jgi:hypothetical protein
MNIPGFLLTLCPCPEGTKVETRKVARQCWIHTCTKCGTSEMIDSTD